MKHVSRILRKSFDFHLFAASLTTIFTLLIPIGISTAFYIYIVLPLLESQGLGAVTSISDVLILKTTLFFFLGGTILSWLFSIASSSALTLRVADAVLSNGSIHFIELIKTSIRRIPNVTLIALLFGILFGILPLLVFLALDASLDIALFNVPLTAILLNPKTFSAFILQESLFIVLAEFFAFALLVLTPAFALMTGVAALSSTSLIDTIKHGFALSINAFGDVLGLMFGVFGILLPLLALFFLGVYLIAFVLHALLLPVHTLLADLAFFGMLGFTAFVLFLYTHNVFFATLADAYHASYGTSDDVSEVLSERSSTKKK